MSASTRILLSTAIKEYMAWREGRRFSADTLKADRIMFNRFLKDVGDKQLASLTNRHVDKWFTAVSTTHRINGHNWSKSHKTNAIAASTFNAYRGRLLTFFAWCQKQGWMKKDIMFNVEPMVVQEVVRLQPTAAQMLGMIETAECPRDRVWLATACNTALRSIELKRITVGQVDLDAGFINGVLISKNGTVDDMPITSDLDSELRRWLTIYAETLGEPLKPDMLLFPSRAGNLFGKKGADGKQVRTPNCWRPYQAQERTEDIIKRALVKIGLETQTYWQGTHTIRRAVARAYFDMLCDDQSYDAALRTTAALLHHKNTSTTERYLGLTVERKNRNQQMRHQPFLTEIVRRGYNVVPLRAVTQGE